MYTFILFLFTGQNLPPVVTVGVGVCSSKNSLVALSFKQQLLIPLVLKCDYSAVKNLLEQLKGKSIKLLYTCTVELLADKAAVLHVLLIDRAKVYAYWHDQHNIAIHSIQYFTYACTIHIYMYNTYIHVHFTLCIYEIYVHVQYLDINFYVKSQEIPSSWTLFSKSGVPVAVTCSTCWPRWASLKTHNHPRPLPRAPPPPTERRGALQLGPHPAEECCERSCNRPWLWPVVLESLPLPLV